MNGFIGDLNLIFIITKLTHSSSFGLLLMLKICSIINSFQPAEKGLKNTFY